MSITETAPRTDVTDLILAEHNEIRDEIKPAGRVASGTDFWWAAEHACRRAKGEYLAEEARDVIPDMHAHTDPALRSDPGRRWLPFDAEHRGAQGFSKAAVDPSEFVRENS